MANQQNPLNAWMGQLAAGPQGPMWDQMQGFASGQMGGQVNPFYQQMLGNMGQGSYQQGLNQFMGNLGYGGQQRQPGPYQGPGQQQNGWGQQPMPNPMQQSPWQPNMPAQQGPQRQPGAYQGQGQQRPRQAMPGGGMQTQSGGGLQHGGYGGTQTRSGGGSQSRNQGGMQTRSGGGLQAGGVPQAGGGPQGNQLNFDPRSQGGQVSPGQYPTGGQSFIGQGGGPQPTGSYQNQKPQGGYNGPWQNVMGTRGGSAGVPPQGGQQPPAPQGPTHDGSAYTGNLAAEQMRVNSAKDARKLEILQQGAAKGNQAAVRQLQSMGHTPNAQAQAPQAQTNQATAQPQQGGQQIQQGPIGPGGVPQGGTPQGGGAPQVNTLQQGGQIGPNPQQGFQRHADPTVASAQQAAAGSPSMMDNSGQGVSGIRNDFMNSQLQGLFDPSRLDPMNDPTMSPMLQAMNQQFGEQRQNASDAISGQFSGGFGGSSAEALQRARTEGQISDAQSSATANTMFNAREANMGRQMQGMGMINSRDQQAAAAQESMRQQMAGLAGQSGLQGNQLAMDERLARLQAQTSRANAQTSANAQQAAASANSANARYSADLQYQLGMGRLGHDSFMGQNNLALQGMGMQMQGDQFDQRMMAQMAGAYDANQNMGFQNAMGMYGMQQGGLQGALGAGIGQQGNNVQRQVGMGNIQNQRDIWNANSQQDFYNNYASMFGNLGSTFGQGTSFAPGFYQGSDPWAAGLTGGLGGAAQGYAAFGGG